MQPPSSATEMRPAILADADPIAAYHHRCFMSTYSAQLVAGTVHAPDPDSTRQQLHEWFGPESEFETHVAVADGAPIAHFTVRQNQLVHLFVDPDHQGMGLGRHLLAEGETMIATRGYTDGELHARVENVAAIAFYEAAGWTVTDRRIHTTEQGISYDEHILVKHFPRGSRPTGSSMASDGSDLGESLS